MNIPGQFRPVELQIRANRFRPFPFSFINITQHRYKQGAIEFNVNRLIEDQDENILAMAKKMDYFCWFVVVRLWSLLMIKVVAISIAMLNVCLLFRQFN